MTIFVDFCKYDVYNVMCVLNMNLRETKCFIFDVIYLCDILLRS